MCGIAGIAHTRSDHPVKEEDIAAMCGQMAHRGPDHFGHRVMGHVGLGMRRLSIIDLNTGQQPISNEDGTVWIVFNGEIYNFRSLRRELEAQGHLFRTASDTEVIVHLYEELGVNCVDRLRGMFAFAIWDERHQRLFIARDRLGIKPLYYVESRDSLLFASEMKALTAIPTVSLQVSADAVFEYFTHMCVPGPLSIFSAIRKLPPGHWITYESGRTRIGRYWELGQQVDETKDEGTWVQLLRERLFDAVSSHMVSDVPIGAFLSGGLDSGAMVAMMSRIATGPVRTFTVGFKTEVGRFDERDAARLVAQKYATDHKECLLESDFTSLLPKIVAAFDEPFADSSAIPNWLVCEETSQHVRVAMSGLGADELFGGYQRYVGVRLGAMLRSLPTFLKRSLAAGAGTYARLSGANATRRDRVERFARAACLEGPSMYRSFIVAFEDASSVLRPDALAESGSTKHYYDEIAEQLRGLDPVDFALHCDQLLYLPDDLLPLSDRVSMAHSLEVRVPFLDHELVEFAATIPSSLKLHCFEKKSIFRKAVGDSLPPSHLKLPKQGFSIPVADWLRGPLKPTLMELASDRVLGNSDWLNPIVVRRLVKEHLEQSANHENRLWSILCFLEWERQASGTARQT